MEKQVIQAEILKTEKKLLLISNKVFAINNIDTMNDWLVEVLTDKSHLEKHFHLPTQPQIKSALLTLVKSNSLLTPSIVGLLAKRISVFFATIYELYNHPLRGNILSPLLTNFELLIKLIKNYNSILEQNKTINLIFDALKNNYLHVYKSRPKESDLRVVLRAFYEDKDREDKKIIEYTLNFILNQLIQNTKQSGFIAQPRHAWWALLTLFQEADGLWLKKNESSINKIIKHQLIEFEYSPKRNVDYTNIVPELDSLYNDKIWVTINAIRFFKHGIERFIPIATIKLIKSKIEQNFNSLINEEQDDSIKNIQSKLLLLYDALGYLNNFDAIELRKNNEIRLPQFCIGKFFYDSDVINQYKLIYPSIESMINNRAIWKKHTLSSLLISGSPGQGKSELAEQLIAQIQKIANVKGKDFEVHYLVIGTSISSREDLRLNLQRFSEQKDGVNKVQVVVFDEFDKADFDFYTPFLPFLENSTRADQPLTFWLFAQSSFPSFEIFKSYADSLSKRSMKDFSTRIKLGTIDLSELKASPQQKILTMLGYAVNSYPEIQEVSRDCVAYFTDEESLQNNRDLISVFNKTTTVEKRKLILNNQTSTLLANKKNNSYIKVIFE